MNACDRNTGRHYFALGQTMPAKCECRGATVEASGEGVYLLTVLPSPDLFDTVYWAVHGDKRQSSVGRLAGIEKRGRAALGLVCPEGPGAPDQMEILLSTHVKGRPA